MRPIKNAAESRKAIPWPSDNALQTRAGKVVRTKYTGERIRGQVRSRTKIGAVAAVSSL